MGTIKGRKAANSTEEEIQHTFEEEYIDEEKQDLVRQALKEGKTVYSGCVDFEECSYNYDTMLEKFWKRLEGISPDEFVRIDGDLSY